MKAVWISKMYFLAVLVLALSVFLGSAIAQAAEQAPTQKEDMGKMSRKLNDPTSNIWALQGEFDYIRNKGDLSNHSTKNQYQFLFQPVLPVPLTTNWKLLTRPVVPIASAPIPRLDSFEDIIGSGSFTSFTFNRNVGLGIKRAGVRSSGWYRKFGLGDITVPLMLSPRKKSPWMLAAGPTLSLPTATDSKLGSGLFEVGPAAVIGYKTKNLTVGTLSQYWWDVAGWGDSNSVSRGSVLYFLYYNIPGPGHWQVGMNPIITYNDKASSGDKWNVPVGITVGKMVKFGKQPAKVQVGVDYSPVYQDNYGERWKFKVMITPVIPALIKEALFH